MRDEKYYDIRNIDFEDEDEYERCRTLTLTFNSVISSGDCFNNIRQLQLKVVVVQQQQVRILVQQQVKVVVQQ